MLRETLHGYDTIIKHGKKLSKHGRASGGIVVCTKRSVSHFFTYVGDFDCGIVFIISDEVFETPTLFIVCYLPPANSPFYKCTQNNGMEILENELIKLKSMYPTYSVILTGDFNARTKDCQDFIQDDSCSYLPLPNFYVEDKFNSKRKTKDTHGELNEYGKLLLNLCCTFDIHFLNGRSLGDREGELTCYTENGSSLVDYTIVSSILHDKLIRFEIGNEDQFTHLPQSYSFCTNLTCNSPSESIKFPSSENARYRFKWTEQSLDVLLNSDVIHSFYESVEAGNTENAVHLLTLLLQTASEKKSCATNIKRSSLK